MIKHFILLPIFLIFTNILSATQVKIKHFSNAGLHRVYSEVKIDKPELFELAKDIDSFRKNYWNFKSSKERLQEIEKLKKLSGKHSIFTSYKEWFIVLADIQDLPSSTDLIKKCNPSKVKNQSLVDKTNNICEILFLSKLGDEISSGKYLTAMQITFLKDHFPGIAQLDYQLQSMLRKSSTNTTVYPLLKRELKNLYKIHTSSKISKSLARTIDFKNVPIKSRKVEASSLSDEKYNELKKNISTMIGMIDHNAAEKDILRKSDELIIKYYKKNSDLLPQHDSLERILKLAEYFTRRKKFDVSTRLLAFVDSHTKKFDNDIHFSLLWTYILKKDLNQALVYIRFNKLDKNYKNYDSKLNYWVSHVLMEKNDQRTAKAILNYTIKNDPLSFYAITASKQLNDMSDKKNFKIKNHPYQLSLDSPEHKFKIIPKDLPSHVKDCLARLQLFAAIDRTPLLSEELEELFRSVNQVQAVTPGATLTEIKADFSLLTAHILHQNEKYLETFKLIYEGINKKYLSFNPQVIKMLFPRPYLSEVTSRLSETIDPMVVISLMRQESSFNPAAQSPVGAMGLMQLMPATAKKLQKKVKKRQLSDPDTNIKLGTKYVEYLMDKYKNNIVFTLAAYNAGESRVTYWREHYFNETSILHDIESIPFAETRNYVKLIYRNIFLYKFINAQEHLSDTSSPDKIFDISLNYPQG